MIGDPRDAWAYRLAVGALGLAVAIALAGAIVIVALGDPPTTSPSSTTTTETTTTKSRVRGGSQVKTVSKASVEGVQAPAAAAATPTGLYVVGGALTGALLGILIPLPWPSRLPPSAGGQAHAGTERDVVTWVLTGLAAAALLAVFVATVTVGVVEHIVALEVLGAVSGAALLGLFVPSPATRQ
jgi:hypothetical protein